MPTQRNLFAQWIQIQRKLAGLGDEHLASSGPATWTPNADVCEGNDGLLIRVELAGVAPESVDVELDEQAIHVRGVRRDPQGSQTAAGYRFRQMEIEYGPFERVIPLPFAVDGTEARAVSRGGILEIRMPRASAMKPTRIRIGGV